jgi:hypothetical protein
MARPKKATGSHAARLRELIEIAARKQDVSLKLFGENQDWVTLEGDRASLEFLGHLLLEFAKETGPHSLILDNPGPLFRKGSAGIVLYRKP